MRFVKFVLFVLFFLFSMVFFVQNQTQLSNALDLKFQLFTLSWQSQPLPFYLIVLIFFVLGALFSTIFFVIDRIRIGSACREAQYKAQNLQSELDALKARPSTASIAPPAPIITPSTPISVPSEASKS